MVRRFRNRVGRPPQAAYPTTLNDRTLWRKVFDHNPLFALLCDKLATKDFYRERCPEMRVVEPMWIGDRAEDIPDEYFQQAVAIKSSVASKRNLVFRQPGADRASVVKQFQKWHSEGCFGASRFEWGYTQSRNRIYVEPCLRTEDGGEPLNVLVSASNGRVAHAFAWKYLLDRRGNVVGRQGSSFFPDGSRRWCDIPLLPSEFEPLPRHFAAPPSLQLACEFAVKLSRGIDYARYDFLCTDAEAYGGEVTVYPLSGYDAWSDPSVPRDVLANWDLRESWFLSVPQPGWRGRYARQLRDALSHV